MSASRKRHHTKVVEKKSPIKSEERDDIDELLAHIEENILSGRIADAKCGLLFACTLYPNCVQLKKVAYDLALKENNIPEATIYFQKLLKAEFNVTEEVSVMLSDVCSTKCSAFREIFFHLPLSVQFELMDSRQSASGSHDKATFRLQLSILRELSRRCGSGGGGSKSSSGSMSELQQNPLYIERLEMLSKALLSADTQFISEKGVDNVSASWFRLTMLQRLFPLIYQASRYDAPLDKSLAQKVYLRCYQLCLCQATHVPSPPHNTAAAKVVLDPHLDHDLESLQPNTVWVSLRRLLQQASVVLLWPTDVNYVHLTMDDAVKLLGDWADQINNHSGRVSIAVKLSRMQVASVYWAFLGEAIMSYLTLARPGLFASCSHAAAPLTENVYFLSGNLHTHSAEDDNDNGALSASDSSGGVVSYVQIYQKFHSAVRLYDTLNSSNTRKFYSKVEVKLRSVGQWLFDRLFMLDFYLTRGSTKAATSAQLLLHTQQGIAEVYPTVDVTFLKALLNMHLGELLTTWKLFLEVLDSLQQTAPARSDNKAVRLSTEAQSLCTMDCSLADEEWEKAAGGHLEEKKPTQTEMLVRCMPMLPLNVHCLQHLMLRFLLFHVAWPRLCRMQRRAATVQSDPASASASCTPLFTPALAVVVLCQVLRLPIQLTPRHTVPVQPNVPLMHALNALYQALSHCEAKDTKLLRHQLKTHLVHIHDVELLAHVHTLLRVCTPDPHDMQGLVGKKVFASCYTPKGGLAISSYKLDVLSTVASFVSQCDAVFHNWM